MQISGGVLISDILYPSAAHHPSCAEFRHLHAFSDSHKSFPSIAFLK
ncbi:hypothetical protein Tco_1478897, partial [Tanacetum coccineum]